MDLLKEIKDKKFPKDESILEIREASRAVLFDENSLIPLLFVSNFTEKELNQGFKIVWLSLDEAISKIKNDKPENYEGSFIQKRDIAFLRKAQQITLNRNTKGAFKWIVGLLQKNNIPFQLSGGFAARLYGSGRPLYDIDIEVQDQYFDTLFPLVKDKIIYGPERYKDNTFDLLLMTLKYGGQKIDISGCETDKLYNSETKQWEPCGTKIDDVVEKEVYGIKVPVIKWQDLVVYKRKIRRQVDLEDVEAIIKKHF